jgi:membrane-bound lytic murein transglycosylase B
MYGQAAGKFRVVDSLTTLAFAYPETPNREPRMAYFRNELKQALLYARESNVDPLSLQVHLQARLVGHNSCPAVFVATQ